MFECDQGKSDVSSSECWKKPGEVMTKFYCRKKRKLPCSASSQYVTTNISSANSQKRKNNPFSKKKPTSTSTDYDKKRILSFSEADSDVFMSDLGGNAPPKSNELSLFETQLYAEDDKESDQSNNDLGFVYVNEDSLPGYLNVVDRSIIETTFQDAVLDNSQQNSCGKLLIMARKIELFQDSADAMKSEVKMKENFPPDWSLKSKARFLSSVTFAWCARMKSSEEASAITKATRCQSDDTYESDSAQRIDLGRNLVYWQHPYIPWLSLFPRYGVDCSLCALSKDELSLTENVKSSLYDSWVIAFRSAYQLVRQGLCPYFYVCSQQYTALFQSPAVRIENEINCILTPTSLGFRNCLKSEGITFTMPLQSKDGEESVGNHSQSAGPNAESETPKNDADIRLLKFRRTFSCPFPSSRPETKQSDSHDDAPAPDQLTEDRDDAKSKSQSEASSQEDIDPEEELSWKNISDSLQFRKAKEITSAVTNDGLPSTTVVVEGLANTQLLFNYLLNCRSSISMSGRQAGVPPTILSPVAFSGASLRKLEYRAGIAKITENSRRHADTSRGFMPKKQRFSLDVTGPLMPHHIHGIVSLLNTTQDHGEYSVSLGSHLFTTSFNARNSSAVPTFSEPDISDTEEARSECGLSLKFAKILKSGTEPECLRKIEAMNGKYNWTA